MNVSCHLHGTHINESCLSQGVVRMRGLPYHVNPSEIQAFFRDLRIKEGGVNMCIGRDGRPNGEVCVLQTHTHTYTHTHIHTHTCRHTHTFTHTHMTGCDRRPNGEVCVIHTYTRTHTHTHIHAHTHIHTDTHTHMISRDRRPNGEVCVFVVVVCS